MKIAGGERRTRSSSLGAGLALTLAERARSSFGMAGALSGMVAIPFSRCAVVA